MMMFGMIAGRENSKIGQNIICIDNKSENTNFPLVINKIYMVKDIILCKCGKYLIDVGIIDKGTMCFCNNFHQKGWIFYSKRFKPLQEQSFPLLTYSKVLEEVLVSSN